MRNFVFATLAALLAACSPPTSAQKSASTATTTTAATTATAPSPELAGALADGAWVFEEGNAASSTGFGPPDSESQFFVQCERGPKIVTLSMEHELAPDQDTTLTLRPNTGSGAQTLTFPARSFNEGLPSVTANLPAPDPRLTSFAAATDRFEVSVGDAHLLLPMDESVKRVLALCGV